MSTKTSLGGQVVPKWHTFVNVQCKKIVYVERQVVKKGKCFVCVDIE